MARRDAGLLSVIRDRREHGWPTSTTVTRALWGALLIGLSLAVLAPGQVAAAARGRADSRPPGGNITDPIVREVDIAQPAIVRIGTEEHVTIALQLCTSTVTLPLNGGSYLVAGTGSGAYVSAHGDILTADHVVHMPDDEIAAVAAQDIADVINRAPAYEPGCAAPSPPITADEVASGFVNISFSTHTLSARTIVWQSTAYTGPLASGAIRDAQSFDAKLVANSPYTQDDLAVIHIDQSDTPSITLDDSASVAVEDRLTLIAFPGNGDVNGNATNFLTPSVNDVLVSAVKVGDNGSPLLQVGGNVEAGDSGGAVLDFAGHVVGIVSFGGPDPRGNTTFLRVSNDAINLLKSQNIDLTPGAFQVRWAHAFRDYAATTLGHWHTAAREMDTLAQDYPHFLALAAYRTYADTAVASEDLASPPARHLDDTTIAIVAGSAALLLVVIVVWVAIARRRSRRKAKLAYAVAAPPGYPGAPGGWSAPFPPTPPTGYAAGAVPPYSYGGYGAYPPQGLPTATPVPQPSLPYPGATAPQEDNASAGGELGAARTTNSSVNVVVAPEGAAPGSEAAPTDSGMCINGHRLLPSEAVCPWCGAPRGWTAGG